MSFLFLQTNFFVINNQRFLQKVRNKSFQVSYLKIRIRFFSEIQIVYSKEFEFEMEGLISVSKNTNAVVSTTTTTTTITVAVAVPSADVVVVSEVDTKNGKQISG